MAETVNDTFDVVRDPIAPRSFAGSAMKYFIGTKTTVVMVELPR